MTGDTVPDSSDSLPECEIREGQVRRLGGWAVGRSRGADFAVSRRCRHQLADLSEGSVDADGCLVCPWHQSRYDVRTGAMVSGPRGFLLYRGPTPGYTQLVLAYGKRLRLRVGRLVRADGRVRVE
jgi:nitrite reductase/ring-hydroxylating ferredoxin subunit